MTDLQGIDLVELFKKEFELCNLTEGEHVIVLSEPTSRPDYVQAAYGAARALGGLVAQVTVPSGTPVPEPATHTGSGPGLEAILENKVVQEALKGADFVIDVTHEGFIHSPLQVEVLDTGTRILFICDAPDVLARNLPSKEDAERVKWGADLMNSKESMYVTSPAGTDFVASLVDCHGGGQKGFVDKPGQWDHWPSTMNLCWPKDSNGTIVLDQGDILLPFKEYVHNKVTLEVKDGDIVSVSGGHEARMLERYMDDIGDRWSRSLSHQGWGIMRSANWFATAMYSKHEIMGMDARAFAGNYLWSTGPHPFLEHDSFAHLDIVMRGVSVRCDDVQVVDSGKLIHQ
ncbi:M29 family metallopeptidase [Nesterenkonia populi]|uniref:hypothetical protein n=1 Tax=Nesterenkonia populi TaxID=1591087 RepID=UPI0011BEF8C6|nr:hypothetical protein [Nesterenkonia populi]